MSKKKILIQFIVCLTILTCLKAGVFTMSADNYSVKDIKECLSSFMDFTLSVPEIISDAAVKANSLSIHGIPLQETDKDVKLVYASRGGIVEKAGVSRDYGKYVIIDHGDEQTYYGFLSEIKAITGERVKKGSVIGNYSNKGNEAFYYEIRNGN